jgi:hypothetical protein
MRASRGVHAAGHEGGSALVIALLILAVLSLLGLAMLGLAVTEGNIATNWLEQTQAFYNADAGVESGVVSLRALLAATASPTDAQLGALAAPALSDARFSFTTFQVGRVRPTPYQTTVDSGSFRGLMGITSDYLITSQVSGPRGSRAGVTQVIQYMQIPLFQFGVFYGRGVDLEIAPGATMTFNGRVHANSNIYVRSDGGGLAFNSFMTAFGNIYRYIKRDGPSVRNANPTIMDANGIARTLNFDHDSAVGWSAWSGGSDWRGTALGTFGGKVLDHDMGVPEIVPPIPALFYNPSNPDTISHELIERGSASDSSALQDAKLYYQAGLRIVNGVATNQSGGAVTLPAGVITTKTFYDKRQAATITVTEVNINALRTSGVAPSNGILYVTNDGANNAVRLVSGAQLPTTTAGGFTVVSEKPVYVQGDYNTTNKVPAAIMADAITVLSNRWSTNSSDTKGDEVTSNRPASNTTVNAAFALGASAESTLNNGNGQLENVIRFLENWSGTTFTYSGSRSLGDAAGTAAATITIRRRGFGRTTRCSTPPSPRVRPAGSPS